MAYDKKNMIDISLKAIEENELIFLSELFTYVPFSEKTFYNHKLQDLQDIKKAIEDNRVKTKSKLRKRWEISDNPTVQIALYKLLADANEYAILNTQAVDHKGAISIHYDKQDAEV